MGTELRIWGPSKRLVDCLIVRSAEINVINAINVINELYSGGENMEHRVHMYTTVQVYIHTLCHPA